MELLISLSSIYGLKSATLMEIVNDMTGTGALCREIENLISIR